MKIVVRIFSSVILTSLLLGSFVYAAPGFNLKTLGGMDFFNFFKDDATNVGIEASSFHTRINDSYLPSPVDNFNYIRGKTFLGNDTVVVTASGNVGIGTTLPLTKTHIEGSAQIPSFTGTTRGLLTLSAPYVSAYYTSMDFLQGLGQNPTARIAQYADGAGSRLVFGTSNNYALGITNTAMTINNVGNVGIGTTNPTSKLHVGNSTTGNNIRIGNGYAAVGDQYSSAVLVLGNNVMANEGATTGLVNIFTHASYAGSAIEVNGGDGITFHTKAGTATAGAAFSSPVMKILSTGNVGIGTINPNRKLDIAVGGDGITIGQDTDNSQTIQTYIDGQWTNRASYASGCCNVLKLQPDVGSVSIGNSSPSAKLDVTGNIRNSAPSSWLELSGDLPGYPINTYPTLKTNGSYIYFSVGGSFSSYITTGGAYTQVSDKNKKENFKELDFQDILTKINKLPLVQWNYKAEDKDIKHIGPFAQDFHALFGLNGPNDKMISTIDPSGVALAGIKGLIQKIDKQEKDIEDLKKENADLKMLICLDHPTAKICK